MSDVASTVINESGGAYPELVEKQKYIHKVNENEEASFNKTIDSGLAILNDKIAASDGKELSVPIRSCTILKRRTSALSRSWAWRCCRPD